MLLLAASMGCTRAHRQKGGHRTSTSLPENSSLGVSVHGGAGKRGQTVLRRKKAKKRVAAGGVLWQEEKDLQAQR